MPDWLEDLMAETERRESIQSLRIKDNIRRSYLHPHDPEYLEPPENDEDN